MDAGLHAVVGPRQGGDGAHGETVIGTWEDELANFRVPKCVYFVDELPGITMGKVQNNMLRDRYAGTREGT